MSDLFGAPGAAAVERWERAIDDLTVAAAQLPDPYLAVDGKLPFPDMTDDQRQLLAQARQRARQINTVRRPLVTEALSALDDRVTKLEKRMNVAPA